MKKLFFFASAMVAALAMNAQTIVIDGNNSEWANIPMLSEPGGAGNLLKYAVPQEGINVGTGNAFAVMVQTANQLATDKNVCLYIDADKSLATNMGESVWFLAGMGLDYKIAKNGDAPEADGTAGVVRSTNVADGIFEMSVPAAAFTNPALGAAFYSQFSFDWGNFYVPNSPEPSGDNWKWDQTAYQPLEVRPYAFADMNGTHLFKDTWSRHQCVAAGDSMNVNVSGGEQDVALWCAWTVEIPANAKYQVTADMVSSDGASCDLYLVDIPTNTVVATFMTTDAGDPGSGIWAPTGETALGEWDLSAIPAGKYMLKAMNHVKWSHMKLYSVKLDGPALPSAINETAIAPAPMKMIRNGRFMINHNGKFINALGF